MATKQSIKLGNIIDNFGLEVLYGPTGYAERHITSVDVNRPALPLCGYFDNFDPTRIQIVGAVELNYLREMSRQSRSRAGMTPSSTPRSRPSS
jgi:HPr kinase/phosphorylase